MKIQTIAAMALGLVMASSVMAQGGRGQGGPPPPGGPGQHRGPGGMGMRMGPMGPGLLLHPDVARELKLTEEQREQLREILPPPMQGGPGGPPPGGFGQGGPPPPGGHGGQGGHGGPPPPGGQGGQGHGGPPPPGGQGQHGGPPPPGGFGQGGPPPGGPRGQGGPGFRGGGPGGQMDKQIQRILNADQFKRYKQIELQVQAPQSITRPDVMEKLNFSREQLEQFHEIHEQMRPPMPPQGNEPPSREEMERMHQKMMAHRDELLRKVLEIFTPEQRRTWDSLTGKPFKLSPPPRREE